MNIILKIVGFVKKLQSLPLSQRKIILWTIVIILGIIMALFWFRAAKERLGGINKEEITKPFKSLMEQQIIQDETNKISEEKNKIKDILGSQEAQDLIKELQKESQKEENNSN